MGNVLGFSNTTYRRYRKEPVASSAWAGERLQELIERVEKPCLHSPWGVRVYGDAVLPECQCL
jgi:hypothetical protein